MVVSKPGPGGSENQDDDGKPRRGGSSTGGSPGRSSGDTRRDAPSRSSSGDTR